jgi:hypothetical protein
VPNLDLEVVRVLVAPVDQGGNEGGESGSDDRGGTEGHDGDFDKSEGGLDDFAVGGGEEDDDGLHHLGEVRLLEGG